MSEKNYFALIFGMFGIGLKSKSFKKYGLFILGVIINFIGLSQAIFGFYNQSIFLIVLSGVLLLSGCYFNYKFEKSQGERA